MSKGDGHLLSCPIENLSDGKREQGTWNMGVWEEGSAIFHF